jgi:Ca-activated chloride channel family protein
VTFASPSLLLLLLAVPLVAIGYRLLERAREARAQLWSRPQMLPNTVRNPLRRWRFVPALAFMIGLSLLVVGVAKPEHVLPASESGAPTVVLAFDLSSSMGAHDVRPTRIAVARSLALKFLHELPASYRVAVVTFGNTPTVTVAPTLDRLQVIASLPHTALRLEGTAIGDAVNEAVSLAAGGVAEVGSTSHPGAVLLFSDGGQNAGGTTPQQAIVSALVDYVPVDTVAVGTLGGTITQVSRAAGYPVDVDIPVPVIAHTLRTFSDQTDGHFFEASAVEHAPSTLDVVYRGLKPYALPGSHVDDLSSFSAALSVVFIAAAVALSGLLFGRVV